MNPIQKVWFRLKLWWQRFKILNGLAPMHANFAKNPLLKYPRNKLCWCGKPVKAKNCCLPKQAAICTVDQAMILTRYMKAVEAQS